MLGYYTRGKLKGIGKKTVAWPNLTRYMNAVLLSYWDEAGKGDQPTWTSISVDFNYPDDVRTDKNGLIGKLLLYA